MKIGMIRFVPILLAVPFLPPAYAGGGYFPPDSMRFTVWNPGLNAVGGIPDRATVFRTVSPGGSDDSGPIQDAINACPAGDVVELAAGTFTVNNYILINKGITLRGAGTGVTILQKTNGAKLNIDGADDAQPIIIVGPGRWPGPDETTSQNLAADGSKGSYSATVENGGGFAPGQCVLLDELSGASWQPDRIGKGQIWASADYRVVWQLHNPGLEWVDDPLEAASPTGGGAASWFCRQDRPTCEIKEIAGVAGNTVTFTTPLHINYRVSHAAQLTRFTATGRGGNGGVHVTYAGIERLSATGGSDGAVRFECAAYSWAKDIEVSLWRGEGIAVNNSFRCEVRDSYIHDAAYASPGGGAYGISLADGSSEILFENNISVRTNKVMVARCCGAGSVFGYNFADQGYINYNVNWIETGLNASHMVGAHHVLFEGNYGFNWDSDFTHGNSIYHTVFRNWLRGVRTPFTNPLDQAPIDDAQPGNGPRRCIGTMAYSSWMTFVGNVLGARNTMSGWTYEDTGAGGNATGSIWMLGWGPGDPPDRVSAATDIRDGNWDWLQEKQSWHTSAPTDLQNSLYLSEKPAFFGANPWPWVDPTTGSVSVLPAMARFESIVSGITSTGAKPATFRLRQNYPNPFNPSTTIVFDLPARNRVSLGIYDILGRRVRILFDGELGSGTHGIEWDGLDGKGHRVSSGLYFVRLTARSGFAAVRKMIVLR